jgi:hypothetical protein
MNEIFPGVLHWTTFHEAIRAPVSSYYVEPAGVLIDPKVPDGGADAFAGHDRPQQVVLTSGNHTRDAAWFAEAFGCVVRASPEGRERIGDALETQEYGDREELAPGVRALRIGVLSPDEYALHLTATEPAISIADGINHYGGALGIFPDELLGDDAQAVKDGLKNRFRGLIESELEFEHLLFAHGDPLVGKGRAALRDFVSGPVGRPGFGPSI